MARFEVSSAPFSSSLPVEERVTLFLRAVYGWMCGTGDHRGDGVDHRGVADIRQPSRRTGCCSGA
jgi:hypothetical protein